MLKTAVLPLIFFSALSVRARASADQWIEVRSSHFTVKTPNSNEKQARVIIESGSSALRWMFQTLFPKAEVDPAAPIVVVAAKGRARDVSSLWNLRHILLRGSFNLPAIS